MHQFCAPIHSKIWDGRKNENEERMKMKAFHPEMEQLSELILLRFLNI